MSISDVPDIRQAGYPAGLSGRVSPGSGPANVRYPAGYPAGYQNSSGY